MGLSRAMAVSRSARRGPGSGGGVWLRALARMRASAYSLLPVPCLSRSRVRGGGRRRLPSGRVVRFHGGAPKHVRAKARLNLLELIDPAIAVLAREMVRAESSADRQRAANSILDRAGVPRRVEGTPLADARDYLVQQLIAARDNTDPDDEGE